MLAAFVLAGAMSGSAEAFTATPFDTEDSRVAQGRPAVPSAEYFVNPAAWNETASHAVRGVVTKIGATFLVLRTSKSRPIDLPFVLTPSTLREGPIEIGSTVSVRYRIEGNSRVAIAVTVRVTKLVSTLGELTVVSSHLRS